MAKQELQSALEWRYATKQFDSKRKISPGDWELLEESLLLSPSSYGLQPWKFIVVNDPSLREKLKAVSWNQSQVTDCSHYAVLLYKEKMDESHIARFIDRMVEVRGIDRAKLKAYEEMMIGDLVKGPRSQTIDTWAKCQTYIAMGFLMETAACLKIDACPMEGLDPHAYDDLLGVHGTGFKTVASVALGYRDAADAYQKVKKVRFLKDEVIEYR